MFRNLVTGDFYIGSSVNLVRRFSRHLFDYRLSKLPLYNAIRKYGIYNFEFAILEYCEADVPTCLSLEQYYLDLYKPVYNILTIAGASTGFKHSDETKLLLSQLHTGELHPKFGIK